MEMLTLIQQVFGVESLSKVSFFKIACLSETLESVENEPRSARPPATKTDDDVQHVQNMLNSERRLNVPMIITDSVVTNKIKITSRY
ncbi:hypothetical protein TNIN_3771 [Trichonephila inaurata madagascariensis]|uniref:Uncharacterized protein n=1 Tax=Trichonephila inaurata madagascariensis TaxID=2747483 RepID=A0A8X6IBH0_9ARAC|nr:hypothetical protein TNIN_3771 [Trichonephila inaurata madagascariensis]